jgi:hypothetical protein
VLLVGTCRDALTVNDRNRNALSNCAEKFF